MLDQLESVMSKKLQDIRDFVDHVLYPPIGVTNKSKPVISAMREEELIALIKSHDTIEKQAVEALETLQKLNWAKWGNFNPDNR